ncbi:NAD-dependent protein deacylase SRT2-like protein [Drosera capensis]
MIADGVRRVSWQTTTAMRSITSKRGNSQTTAAIFHSSTKLHGADRLHFEPFLHSGDQFLGFDYQSSQNQQQHRSRRFKCRFVMRLSSRLFLPNVTNPWEIMGTMLHDVIPSTSMTRQSTRIMRKTGVRGVRFVQTSFRISIPGVPAANKEKTTTNLSKDKNMVPYSAPPSMKDLDLLHQFFDQRSLDIIKLVVLTGAGFFAESSHDKSSSESVLFDYAE